MSLEAKKRPHAESTTVTTDELSFFCPWCDGKHDLTPQIECMRLEQRCSCSLIQRRFRFGYAHALLVLEQLEKRGFITIDEIKGCILRGLSDPPVSSSEGSR